MSYKYKLVVSKKQKQLLFNHIFIHNQTWNILLNHFFNESESNKFRKEQNLDPIYLSEVDKDSMIKKILKNRNLNLNLKIILSAQYRIKNN